MPKIVVTKTRTTTPADTVAITEDTVAITEDTVPRTNPENRQKHRGPDEGHPRRSTGDQHMQPHIYSLGDRPRHAVQQSLVIQHCLFQTPTYCVT